MPWTIVDNPPTTDAYVPGPPAAPYVTVRGEVRPEGPTVDRYPVTERELAGREITVVLQLRVTPLTNGLGVWYQGSPGRATWYFESSHFKNTLLNDPEFNRLVVQLQADAGLVPPPADVQPAPRP